MTNRLIVSKAKESGRAFLRRATDTVVPNYVEPDPVTSRENSLEFHEPRGRNTVSGSLSKKVQEEAALLTSQVREAQKDTATEKEVMQSDEEKMNQRRQMPLPKVTQLNPGLHMEPKVLFLSPVLVTLTTVPHVTRRYTVMIMTSLTRENSRDKSKVEFRTLYRD